MKYKTQKTSYKGKNNPNFNNKWTEEMKRNLSDKLKGRKNPKHSKFMKGNTYGKNNKGKSHPAWNKDLTKETDERIKKSAIKISRTQKEQYKNGIRKSVKGFLGKTHTKKWKNHLSKRFKKDNPAKRLEVKEKIRQYNLGKKYSKETNIKKGHPGKKNCNWRGGISFLPYTKDFNKKLKELIKERDNYICCICKNIGKIVHHIDYNKKNCNPKNLILLCSSCHCKTNYNRSKWRKYFNAKN